ARSLVAKADDLPTELVKLLWTGGVKHEEMSAMQQSLIQGSSLSVGVFLQGGNLWGSVPYSCVDSRLTGTTFWIDVNKVLHLKKQISNHMEGKQMYINGTINRDTLAWSKDEQSRLDGLNKYSIQLLSYDDTSRISVLCWSI
ncbi:hypothetical protein Tco_0742071, partial [Tanacetum coccineum]